MYQERFGLHRKPFQAVHSDSDFFSSENFRELLPAVLNAVQSDLGVAVLTGLSGVGKTVTLENIRRTLEPAIRTVFVRGGTVRSADDLLYALHRQLLKVQSDNTAQASNTVRRWEVVERLQRVAEFWGPLTVLLDDVHLVHSDVFSELRTLLEEEADGLKLIRLLIAGPLSLEEVLAQPSMGDFAQKIRTHVFLEPLRTAESVSYLKHQVTAAGGCLEDLFQPEAVEKIVVAADGMPRCLNLLADESLMVCEETDQNQVTPHIVSLALARLQHLPVTWNDIAVADADIASSEADNVSEPLTEVDTDSVIEIGSPAVPDVPSGVIEFGAEPAPVASGVESQVSETQAEPDDTEDALCLGQDIDTGCCEFVGDDEICRDNTIVEHLSDLSDVVEDEIGVEAKAPATVDDEAGVIDESEPDDLNEASEVSQAEFFAEAFLPEELSSDDRSGGEFHDADLQDSTLAVETEFDNLERHLLLAASDQAEELSDLEAGTYPDDESYDDFQQVVSCDSDSDCDRTVSDSSAVNLFAEYHPWTPAGSWPAPALETDAAEDSVYAAQFGNATPVFDRYTWCELGRNVSSATLARRQTSPLLTLPAEWPPTVEGVAPHDPIAVEDIDECSHDLLTGLPYGVGTCAVSGTVVEKSGDQDAVLATDDILSMPLEDRKRSYDDQAETSSDGSSQAHVTGTPWPLQRDISEAEESHSEHSEHLEVSTDMAAVIANAVERYISEAGSGATPVPVGDDVPEQSSPPGSGHHLLITDEDELPQEVGEEYSDEILREARARIISVMAVQQARRRAAGAENSPVPLPDADYEDDDQPRLSISDHLHTGQESDEYQQDADDQPRGESGGRSRFRDLFTRLRRKSG